MIKAIIFDWDNTIINTFPFSFKLHNAIAKNFNLPPVSKKRFAEVWGTPWPEMVKAMWEKVNVGKFKKSFLAYLHLHHAKEIRRSFSHLKSLEKSYILGILTHSTRAQIDSYTSYKNCILSKVHFFEIRTADEIAKTPKPDPRSIAPMIVRLRSLGIKKHEILYVGDDSLDCLLAKNAGLHFIAVLTGLRSSSDFKMLGAKNILTNISKVTTKYINTRFR